jgi:prolyl oligopeptidase
MHRFTFTARFALLAVALSACTSQPAPTPLAAKLSYPAAPRGDVVDMHHGVTVADPYRWLEDADSAATREWIDAQNRLTRSILDAVPERAELTARLTELWNYERYGLPERHGERWFVTRNDGLQNQAVLYKLDSLDGAPQVLLDPNTLSADGTVALSGLEFSHDGRYLAYGVADGGSDWNVWRIRDIATGADLPDELRWIKFAPPAWAPDSKGLYYSRYDEPQPGAELEAVNYNQKLCFHALGTPQSADALVLARPDHKEWSFAPTLGRARHGARGGDAAVARTRAAERRQARRSGSGRRTLHPGLHQGRTQLGASSRTRRRVPARGRVARRRQRERL